MDSITIALLAILSGAYTALTYVCGYYAGRKDRTPGDRR